MQFYNEKPGKLYFVRQDLKNDDPRRLYRLRMAGFERLPILYKFRKKAYNSRNVTRLIGIK